jgi:hypothetical protein
MKAKRRTKPGHNVSHDNRIALPFEKAIEVLLSVKPKKAVKRKNKYDR